MFGQPNGIGGIREDPFVAREPLDTPLRRPGALTNLLRLISNNNAIAGLATWVTHPRLPAQRFYKTVLVSYNRPG
jgi:hypothetical protein